MDALFIYLFMHVPVIFTAYQVRRLARRMNEETFRIAGLISFLLVSMLLYVGALINIARSTDAQAGIARLFVPYQAIFFGLVIGGVFFLIQKMLRKSDTNKSLNTTIARLSYGLFILTIVHFVFEFGQSIARDL